MRKSDLLLRARENLARALRQRAALLRHRAKLDAMQARLSEDLRTQNELVARCEGTLKEVENL